MLNAIIDWVTSFMAQLGAPAVGAAIFLENVFPPIPSEVVLPLAGFTVSQGGMSFLGAFLWSTLGSLLGAFVLYGVGAGIGVRRLRAIADWMWLVKPADVDKALEWFDKHGQWSIFFGRLIPGVRSLISIPAGVNRMSLFHFTLMTAAGSALWNALLIWLGFTLGEQYTKVATYIGHYSNVVYALLVVGFLWLGWHLYRRNSRASSDA